VLRRLRQRRRLAPPHRQRLHLKTITGKQDLTLINTYTFKAPFAQPIFDKNFVANMPGFETPIENFYNANLDMTYPYDRGTNYAVKLGKQVAEKLR
jgi:protoporphyrinogen oxidase